jgi:hypothetical protein
MFRLIFIFFITLSGCNADNSTITETVTNTKASTESMISKKELSNKALSSVIEIRTEQVTKYENLSLRFIALEDSRCPVGVECIWAGQLVVTLGVSNEDGDKVEVKLIRKLESEVVNAFGYRLLLLSVEPYPKEGKIIELSARVIKLEIMKSDVK